MTRAGAFTLTVALAAVSGASDEKLSDFAGPTPNLQPTLSSIQREIFSAPDSTGRPACTQCHAGRFGSGGLVLVDGQSYAALVNRPSSAKRSAVRVVPGDPEGSYLLHKVEGRSSIVGERMPNGGPYLSAGQIAIIRRWIELGAKND